MYGARIDPDAYPLGKDESVWKAEGERIIKEAAVEAGASEEQIDIQWKAGRIVVTVEGGFAYVKPKDDGDDGLVDEDFGNRGAEFEYGEDELEEDGDDPEEGGNVVTIARKINRAFAEEAEDSVGFPIAVHHSVEVTTPGASDELYGIMFESYKGFDVIVQMIDPKTKKNKVIEGKLIERTEDTTVINQKGRIRKLKNYNVMSVKLPKAKKEKGGR